MPFTEILLFQEDDGEIPLTRWLTELKQSQPRAYQKALAAILRLETFGYELRRPTADMLRDGIYELRFRVQRVQYRVLYFFHGKDAVVLSHGLTKESNVPNADIETALRRRALVLASPAKHIAHWNAS